MTEAGFAAREGSALVVGGSGGIGSSITRMLASQGCDVIVGYRSNLDAAQRTAQQAAAYGVSTAVIELDTSTDCAETIGVLDLHTLVYAAGPHVPMVHLSRVPPADMAEQLTADTAAFFRVVQPALASLRTRRGSIVAVTTAATERFPVRDGLSSAPKAAIEAMVRALAVEEGRFGVRANSVGPGMLTDGMAEGLISSGELSEKALEITRRNIPLRRFGRAADVAEAVCFLASDKAGFISGQKLCVDGGYSA